MVDWPNTKAGQIREAYFFGLALTVVMAIINPRSQTRTIEVESMLSSELLVEIKSLNQSSLGKQERQALHRL